MTAGTTFANTIRKRLSIGTRTRRYRADQDLHKDVLLAIDDAVCSPYMMNPVTAQALAVAKEAAHGWDKHINGYRIAGEVVSKLKSLSAWQMVGVLAQMIDDGVSTSWEAEQWFIRNRAQIMGE